MIEFITAHIETLSSIVTILVGVGAMLVLLLRHMDKRLDRLEAQIKAIEQRMSRIEYEVMRIHTHLITCLMSNIRGSIEQDKESK